MPGTPPLPLPSGPARLAIVVGRSGEVAVACARALQVTRPDLAVVAVGGAPPDDAVGHRPVDDDDDAALAAAVGAEVEAAGPAAVVVFVSRLGVPDRPTGPGDDVALATEVLRRVTPGMVAAGDGRVVLVGEVTGVAGAAWDDGAGAAMWGLVGLARTAGRDLARHGITVNLVRAGVVDTERLRDGADADPALAATVAAVVAESPLRRLVAPEEVAASVSFLASADAAYVTGVVLPVDGGLAMGQG